MVEQIIKGRYPHLPSIVLTLVGMPFIGACLTLGKRPALRDNSAGAKFFGVLFMMLDIILFISLFFREFDVLFWLILIWAVFPLLFVAGYLTALSERVSMYQEDVDRFWNWLVQKDGTCLREELDNFSWKGWPKFPWIKDYRRLVLEDLRKNGLLEYCWEGDRFHARFTGVIIEGGGGEKTWTCSGCGAENSMKSSQCEYCGSSR